MILTSYSRLVIESHQADCAGLLAGVSNRFRRRHNDLIELESYPDREAVLVRLDASRLRASEEIEFAHVGSRTIRGAA